MYKYVYKCEPVFKSLPDLQTKESSSKEDEATKKINDLENELKSLTTQLTNSIKMEQQWQKKYEEETQKLTLENLELRTEIKRLKEPESYWRKRYLEVSAEKKKLLDQIEAETEIGTEVSSDDFSPPIDYKKEITQDEIDELENDAMPMQFAVAASYLDEMILRLSHEVLRLKKKLSSENSEAYDFKEHTPTKEQLLDAEVGRLKNRILSQEAEIKRLFENGSPRLRQMLRAATHLWVDYEVLLLPFRQAEENAQKILNKEVSPSLIKVEYSTEDGDTYSEYIPLDFFSKLNWVLLDQKKFQQSLSKTQKEDQQRLRKELQTSALAKYM